MGDTDQNTAVAPAEPTAASHAAFRIRLVEILKSQEDILPPAQSSLGRLYQLFQAPDSSVEDCVEIIKLDPAMTARIFRLANSVAYRGKATTISEAMIHLGFAQVRQIAFSAGFFKKFAELKLPPGMEQFWLRNIFVARLTERICAQFQLFGGMEYLSGLLHDTGWLLLAAHFPTELEQIAASDKPSPASEKEILSFSHAEIAAAICATSLLPLRVTNAVVNHHAPLALLVGGIPPSHNSDVFLGVVLNVCDKIADSCQLEIPWQKSGLTLDGVKESPEAKWLTQFGKVIKYEAMIEEELPKAQEICRALTGGK